MTTEIVEKVIMEEFKIEENRNQDIVAREAKILDSNAIKELLESEVFKELKRRIRDGDETALEILVAAKEKVKHDLPIYANTLKLSILALKPFYLIALMSLMTQLPENV
jgi:hypothetical protein